jgi:MFS transporter, DHA2 family, multidrug resistance protein
MSEAALSAPSQPLSGGRLWLAAIGLALVNFVVILDTTITNVSVPHIAGALAVSPSQGTWTITSYAVAEAITVPLSGWLAARFGTVRTLLWAIGGFALFSTLCGMARTIEMLVAVRVLQGLCGGPLMPMTQTLMMLIFPPEQRATANGLWGMTAIFGPVAGPVIGGFISDNWSWPWIFYINLPVVALCMAIVVSLVRRYETPTRRMAIDLVGLALLVAFVGALQLVLDLGRERDWLSSPLILTLAIVSGLSFLAFLIWELTDDEPIVDLRVLRHRSLWVGLIMVGLCFGAIFGMIVLIPLWLQSVMDYTAESAGHVMAMIGITAVLMAPVASKLPEKIDVRILINGALLWLAFVCVLRTQWTTDWAFWSISVQLLMQGMAMPLFFIGVMTLAMNGVPEREIASASGLLNFVRTVSGAAGAALTAAMWDDSSRMARNGLAGAMTGTDQHLAALQAAGVDLPVGTALIDRMVDAQALTLGAEHVYAIVAILLFASSWLIWLSPRPTALPADLAVH